MITDFDEPARIEMAVCYDHQIEEAVYSYVMVQMGESAELVPVCYDAWWARQVKARARMGGNEKKTN